MECKAPLFIFAVVLLLAGLTVIRLALRAGRRYGLGSASFWATFFQYPRYRIRRIWPALLGVAGLILVISGAVSLFQWVLVYYAQRLGHPVGPLKP